MNYRSPFIYTAKEIAGYTSLKKNNLKTNKSFLSIFINWSWAVLVIVSLFQYFSFWNWQNAFAIFCVIGAWALCTSIFLRAQILKLFPFSSFLIIGFILTQFYFPLLFTALENKPVIYNLKLPVLVFVHSSAALLVLLITHYIYRQVCKNQYRGTHSILYRLKLFQPPTHAQVWLIGFAGIAASYYIFFIDPSIYREFTGSAENKLLQSLIPFSYAPFFIPLAKLYGSDKQQDKKTWIMLALYTIILFIISIGRNSRGAFMMGFTSIAFAYLLGLMVGIFKPNFFTMKNAFIALIGIWLITGPVADLGTAMVNVRNTRNDVKASELISLTLIAFQDKKAIKLRRHEDNLKESLWDERYLNNIFTARFSNLKFNDVNLELAKKIGFHNPDMRNYTINRSLAAFPQPVLSALNIDVDKNSIISLSFGDYIYNLAGAGNVVFGSFLTGHFAGTGMAAFGWWYLLILGIGMMPIFLLIDKLAFIKKADNAENGVRLRFSFCGLLILTPIFQFLPLESVASIVNYIFRGWLQMIVLYALLFYCTRIIASSLIYLKRK